MVYHDYTYSFLSDFPSYYTEGNKATVGTPSPLSAAQKQVIVGILAYIQTVTGLNFVEVDPASGSVGNVTFGVGSNDADS